MNRRTFFHQTSALAAVSALPKLRAADAAQKKLKVAVVALGRGMGHVQALLKLPNVEIAYLAEVDPKRLESGLKVVNDTQQVSCVGVKDFRTILDDKTLTRSSSPRRISGTRLPRCCACRPGSMSMWKNPAARTRMRPR
jgi:hypothetical protein